MLRLTLAAAGVALLAACSTGPRAGTVQPVSAATPEQRAALLDRVKGLAGTWEMADDKGQRQTGAVFAVTSNGSAVREIMFPGSSHEMTNMYTMDGSTMVMTHYCSQGNQPKLRATAGGSWTREIELKLDGVSNMTSADQMYMGSLTIEFKDPNTIVERWTSYQSGKVEEHAVFELHRKRA